MPSPSWSRGSSREFASALLLCVTLKSECLLPRMPHTFRKSYFSFHQLHSQALECPVHREVGDTALDEKKLEETWKLARADWK